MKAVNPKIPEKLPFLLLVLSHDQQLFRWFRSLRGLSSVERRHEIGSLARRMHEKRGDPEIIDALFYLSDATNFDVTYQALTEFVDETHTQI